jgi:hypothetical protein
MSGFDSRSEYKALMLASRLCFSKQTNAKVAQLVEHDLAKVGVASSNLVFRSKAFLSFREGFFDFTPLLT